MTGAAADPPPPPVPLAPGFRFHPTDEELVSYYLKRKVSGRPLRLDAIAEVDLYKGEPWDLPSLSRLRSRDLEWYFFSPLDRKYATKSRTNRATSQGYWKTTGKDREVRRGARLVGMKKTLVFHHGRAPRGERTNWVMHEYRLESGDACPPPSVPQDAYVVCRIFQKHGSGPQNGAQYGAPFVEEEWEEEEADAIGLMRVDGDEEFPEAEDNDYLQMNDLAQNQFLSNQIESAPLSQPVSNGPDVESHQEDPVMSLKILKEQCSLDKAQSQCLINQIESVPILDPASNGLDVVSHQEDPVVSLEEILQEETSFCETMDYIDKPVEQNNGAIDVDVAENVSMVNWSSCPSQNDEDINMNVHADAANYNHCSSNGSLPWPLRACSNQNGVGGLPSDINLQKILDVEEFFEATDAHFAQPEQSQNCPLVPPIAGDHYSGEQASANMAFSDTPADNQASEHHDFLHLNGLFYPPVASSSQLDLVDELMAYFDATEDDLRFDILGNVEKYDRHGSFVTGNDNITQQVDDAKVTTYKEASTSTEINGPCAASSSATPPEDKNCLHNKTDLTALDVEGKGVCHEGIGKSLVSMLGSFSAPPALAAEFPIGSGKSAGSLAASAPSASSVRISAGMIEIGMTFTGCGGHEHWSLHKSLDFIFPVSCNVAAVNTLTKSRGFDPVTKAHEGAGLMVLRGGFFYLFFLSAVILTLSYKLGCMYLWQVS